MAVLTGYYKGKIKVVGEDMMCFPVHAATLEPLSCGCYDPYAWSDPDPEAIETIGTMEWLRRLEELRGIAGSSYGRN